MTITISSDLESRLRDRASRTGQDVDSAAEDLLAAALEWESSDREAAIAGIRRGLEASDAGRVRPAADVFAELRAQLPRDVS